MDSLEGTVNWSRIAAEAFERELNRKEDTTMESVIERLRASKMQRGLDYFALGEARGLEWAKHTAEYGDLRRLERFDVVDMLHKPEARNDLTWADAIAFQILPGPFAHTQAEAAEFWRSSAGVLEKEHLKSVKFLQGFITGALSIYRTVNTALSRD